MAVKLKKKGRTKIKRKAKITGEFHSESASVLDDWKNKFSFIKLVKGDDADNVLYVSSNRSWRLLRKYHNGRREWLYEVQVVVGDPLKKSRHYWLTDVVYQQLDAAVGFLVARVLRLY